ncbi:MAG: HAMP domain-containing histidine kinase [Clostridiales bacterium]|nr:HAMP domain-containing histidine kinase [Clostridiales bacterium]
MGVSKNKAGPRRAHKNSLFTRYLVLFAALLFIVMAILGTALIVILNSYYMSSTKQQLQNSVAAIADSVEDTLIVQDMNSTYSVEKEMVCKTLATISQSSETDVFVCDVEGNIILCKERAEASRTSGGFSQCSVHDGFEIKSNLLSSVYQNGETVQKVHLMGQKYLAVGKVIYSDGEIIGTVFALADAGAPSFMLVFLRIFLLSAFFCLVIGYICIYYLTKKMVTPLRQMSHAAKCFATGDFSYRIKTEGFDEIAELGKAFNNMASSLDAIESSRRGFISNVSHELKTPMTSIAGFIDGILDGTIPQEKQKYYLGIVSSEVRRLSRLVVSMLNMSKIESGDVVMRPGSFDICEKIVAILLTFEQKIEEKNIEIKGLDELGQCYIAADSDMIYQAIYNLVDNAVKFTPDGGCIEVLLQETAADVSISIKNSGRGIEQKELSKIFERFYKVDKSRSLDSNGAGLGLYIVKLIIELHGGNIRAESDGESYTCFSICLPRQYKSVYKKEKSTNE